MQLCEEVDHVLTACIKALILLTIVHDLGEEAADDGGAGLSLLCILLHDLGALLLKDPHRLMIGVVHIRTYQHTDDETGYTAEIEPEKRGENPAPLTKLLSARQL